MNHHIEAKPASRRWWKSEWLRTATLLLCLFAFRDSFANHYVVPSGSMQPTLQPGDRVVVDMRAYGLRLPFTNIELLRGAEPQRGDIAIFRSPADGERLIKRVVAVGGDEVRVEDGHLFVNGVPAAIPGVENEEALSSKTYALDLSDGGGPDTALRVPDGQVLVMGDHRGNSADGRFFGTLPADALYAKATKVYWRRGEALVWKPL